MPWLNSDSTVTTDHTTSQHTEASASLNASCVDVGASSIPIWHRFEGSGRRALQGEKN